MKVVVVGTGYVGLVSGVGLAEIGHEVVCVDVDQAKVESIRRGEPPIHEEGLPALLKKQVDAGRLTASTDLGAALAGADVSLIAVGTPFDGSVIDLQYVKQAATDIGRHLPKGRYHVVCVKSTVVPGTTSDVVGPLVEAASGLVAGRDFGLCMNPEFLAEGTAVKDFMNPDRIVIGTREARTESVMRELYAPFARTEVVVTTPSTAEMGKYTANALLATLISFSNEIADLCSRCGDVDVVDVLRTVYLDRRISPVTPQGRVSPGVLAFLHPGTGFGGSCFPKDLKALAAFGSAKGAMPGILDAVIARNRLQPGVLVDLAKQRLGSLAGRRIAVLGLAFKPGTDDIRESPAVPVIRMLLDEQATVVAHDPIAIEPTSRVLSSPRLSFTGSLEDALQGADAALLVTSWPQYKELPQLLRGKDIPLVDGRRFISPADLPAYEGIGRARS
ncbi:UDP-glucose dehydrogenase family protein [Ramlibacter albus]|uniref:UDP-glucose 6-dehydrogenase n=1 Tax=Ramlibacter albus TaxID=2079448 RepID=A0A923M596_9BURK|nr:UDP-glucose/GDP-mannose dehydrogenase family protein [Ramlibacter albus]